MDVYFVEAFLHRRVIDLVGRIGQVSGDAGEAAGHHGRWDGANRTAFVDRVGSDEKLARLRVDHAAGGRAPDAFGADGQVEVVGDFVEFVAGPARGMRRVGDRPQSTGP